MKLNQNINIKAILFEDIAIKNQKNIDAFILDIKKYGVKTILLSDSIGQVALFDEKYPRLGYEGISKKIHIPAFHCVAFTNDNDSIREAKAEGIKVITLGTGCC